MIQGVKCLYEVMKCAKVVVLLHISVKLLQLSNGTLQMGECMVCELFLNKADVKTTTI